MPSAYWGIIDSLNEYFGSWGQNGMSKAASMSLQASRGLICGVLPMPVVEKGLKILDMAYIDSGEVFPALPETFLMIKRRRPSIVGQRHYVLTTIHRRPNSSYGKAFCQWWPYKRFIFFFVPLCSCGACYAYVCASSSYAISLRYPRPHLLLILPVWQFGQFMNYPTSYLF